MIVFLLRFKASLPILWAVFLHPLDISISEDIQCVKCFLHEFLTSFDAMRQKHKAHEQGALMGFGYQLLDSSSFISRSISATAQARCTRQQPS